VAIKIIVFTYKLRLRLGRISNEALVVIRRFIFVE
jgi:hypothetical protein